MIMACQFPISPISIFHIVMRLPLHLHAHAAPALDPRHKNVLFTARSNCVQFSNLNRMCEWPRERNSSVFVRFHLIWLERKVVNLFFSGFLSQTTSQQQLFRLLTSSLFNYPTWTFVSGKWKALSSWKWEKFCLSFRGWQIKGFNEFRNGTKFC